jgi:outer membrane receptor protein involved in Fe transport
LLLAQTTTPLQGIQGTITDAANNEPLIAATIKIGQKGVVTDVNGAYSIDLQAGTYTIDFSYIGYDAKKVTITLAAGAQIMLNISLTESTNLLNAVVSSSTKFDRPLAEITVSMEVLKPDLVKSTNSVSIDGALKRLPGVDVVDGQANIRGGSGFSYGAGSRVLLLMDDIPALQADAGFPNWSDIPTENIDQVEVIKGASSALYGSAALNGVINVRTAYAKSKPETEIATYYTHYFKPKDAQKVWWNKSPFQTGLTIAHRQKFNKFDLVVGGLLLRDSSYLQSTYDRVGRVTVGTRYRFTDKLVAGINFNLNQGKKGYYFYWKDENAGAFQGNPTTLNTNDRVRFTIDPFVTYFDNAGNRHKLLGRLYSVDNKVAQNQSNSSQLYYGEYQFQRNMESINLVTTAGLVGTFTNVDAALYGNAKYSSENYAAYAQADKKFFNKLNVSLGARYEANTLRSPAEVIGIKIPNNGVTREAKPVFRLGMNYQAASFTYLRASVGQGYRYPTVAEKFISTKLSLLPITPNPLLQSESGWSAEIGLKQGYQIGDFKGFLDVAPFIMEYKNMIEFQLAGTLKANNIGDTRISGIELGTAGKGNVGNSELSLLAGYIYMNPVFKNFTQQDNNASSADYNILKYRYKHSIKLDAESTYKGFSGGVSGTYNSNMEAIDAIFEIIVPGLKKYRAANTKGFKVFDLRTAYNINEKFKIHFILKNIFNEEYAARPALMDAPRNLTMKLSIKL